MRIRTVKPEFWRSEDIADLALEDRLLFIGLWSYVDDNGVGRDEVAIIAADLFAADLYKEPQETFMRVSRGLLNLFQAGLIVRYVSENRAYLEIVNWGKHQKIGHPAKPRFPHYDADRDALMKVSRESHEVLTPGTEEQRNRGTEEQRITPQLTSFAGPSRDERTDDAQETPSKPKREPRGTRIPDDWQPSEALAAWTRENAPAAANPREVAQFRDYWAQQTGQKARKADWDATWRTWARRTQENADRKPNNRPLGLVQPTTDEQTQAIVNRIYTPPLLQEILAHEAAEQAEKEATA